MINKEILLALAEKWEKDVEKDREGVRDGSDSAKITNAKQDGINSGLLRCAVDLKTIIRLLAN